MRHIIALSFLQREGYIEFTEEINNPSRVHFIVGKRRSLYKFQVANESFDSFIKLLLAFIHWDVFRLCSGINEEFLSKKDRGFTRMLFIST
jgi:ATP-dependent DNA helicase RecQ